MFNVRRYSLRLEDNDSCRRNWTIEVVVEGTDESVDPNVFVYHASATNHPTGTDHFNNVASLQDMCLLPTEAAFEIEGANGTEDYIPYYRTNTAKFDCFTTSQADEIWRIIKFDLKRLEREYNARERLQEEEVVQI